MIDNNPKINADSNFGFLVVTASFLLLLVGIFIGSHFNDADRWRLDELQRQNAELKGELNAIGRFK